MEEIGSGHDHLLLELEKLYWLGAKAEIDNIVTTLRAWRDDKALCDVLGDNGLKIPAELDGYEFFVDSVSRWTREHAPKHGSYLLRRRHLTCIGAIPRRCLTAD